MKQKNKRTLREDFRLLARAFRIWHKISPTYWLFQALPILTDTFLPYFAVYMSAELLNELAGGRNPQKMLWLAVVTVAGSFILNLITRILQLHTTLVSADFEQRKRIYIFDLENAFQYEHLANSDVILERQELSTIENSTGGGFRKVSEAVGSLLKGLLNIAFSVALTISMFRMRAAGQISGVLGFVNSPYSSVVIIALVLINAVLGIRIATVRTEKLAEATSTLSAFNTRYFTFADNFGPDMIVFRLNRLVNDEFEKHSLHPVWIDGIARVNIRYNSFSILLSAVTHLSVFLFTAAKAYIGVFGIGSLVLYQSTVERFVNAVAITTKAVGELRFNNQYLEKLYKYLDLPNEMYKGTLAVEKRDDIDYEIEFRDVSFKYPRTETWALRHVNMKFKIGDKLAIVGENGSGKTTFIKLLCRLYDPTEGKILLNGIDITRYRYDEYMALFSVVFQDYALFQFPLAANVAASFDWDAERVRDCLVRAGLEEKLDGLERGIETPVGRDYDSDGVDFSGGEMQKIALARALYKDAPFVILDEPTAALDPIAEAAVYENFNTLTQNKTSVFISHRLSSCRFCDEIAVFDHGMLVQEGTHEKLVGETGKYAELWHAQAKYYEGERVS